MQPTAWEVDVDEHYGTWATRMRTLAEGLCEPPTKQPTNQYLTPETLDIVAQRSAIRQYLRLEDHERRRRLQLIAFGAFSSAHTRTGFRGSGSVAGRGLAARAGPQCGTGG